MTQTQLLVDQIRALDAQAAGKRLELCMAVGDRDGANHWLREMESQIEARQAARESGCYFTECGESDRLAMLGNPG